MDDPSLVGAADVKISALPAATSVAATDEIPANQSGTTRKLTPAQVKTYLGLYTAALTGQYTNSSTTGTEATGLQVSLTAGTYTICGNVRASAEVPNVLRAEPERTLASAARLAGECLQVARAAKKIGRAHV